MKTKKLWFLMLLICFLSLGEFTAQNSVTPIEFEEPLRNPFKGFRPGDDKLNNPDRINPYTTLIREYIRWGNIEEDDSYGLTEFKAYNDDKWAGIEDRNIKIVPRVIMQFSGPFEFPSDIVPNGDLEHPDLIPRLRDLIARMGEAWDNDSRVAWVQTGMVGKWGEQNTAPLLEDYIPGSTSVTWSDFLQEEFLKAFKNKKVQVSNLTEWSEFENFGQYWDSFGNASKMNGPTDAYPKLLENYVDNGLYLTQRLAGEPAYDLGDPKPQIGNDADETFRSDESTSWIINVSKKLHTSALGWVSSYRHQDPVLHERAKRLQKALGYRFAITNVECPARVEQGDTFTAKFSVRNDGAAPFYEDWPVAALILDESGAIVHRQMLPAYDVKSWLPGSDYDWHVDPSKATTPGYWGEGNPSYNNPPLNNEVVANINVPSNLSDGKYMLSLAVLDPTSNRPGIFFAVENFIASSQTQPLIRFGIGRNLTANEHIVSMTNENPVDNDARYYVNEIVAVTGVSVTPSTLDVGEGGVAQLAASIQPFNATEKGLLWSSSNTSVATVNSNGEVTGVSLGTTDITVKTVDGNYTDTSRVTVKNISVTGISISPSEYLLGFGANKQLVANLLPVNASSTNINWASSNNSIVSVNENGMVTGISEGTATITATATANDLTAQSIITVTDCSDDLSYNSNQTAEVDINNPNYTFGPVNVSCSPQVYVSFDVSDSNNLENSGGDWFNVVLKLDGVEVASQRHVGKAVELPNQKVTFNDIATDSASNLTIEITSNFSTGGEKYYFNNLRITVFEQGSLSTPELDEAGVQHNFDFKAFPVPCKDFINIKSNFISNAKFELYSIYGRLIRSQDIVKEIQRIDLSGIHSGMYIIKMVSDNETKAITIIKE